MINTIINGFVMSEAPISYLKTLAEHVVKSPVKEHYFFVGARGWTLISDIFEFDPGEMKKDADPVQRLIREYQCIPENSDVRFSDDCSCVLHVGDGSLPVDVSIKRIAPPGSPVEFRVLMSLPDVDDLRNNLQKRVEKLESRLMRIETRNTAIGEVRVGT